MGIAYLLTMGFVFVGWILDIFTLFAQVDVCNGFRAKEDATLSAGFNRLLSISRGMQSMEKSLKVDKSELVMCKYCGQTHRNPQVFTSSHFHCHGSPTGRHVLK